MIATLVRARLGPWLLLLSLVLTTVALAPPAEADRDGLCQRRGRRRRARRPRLTAAQRRAIRRRHERAPRTAVSAWLRHDPPPLVFRPSRGLEVRLSPDGDEGGFDPEDLAAAARALAFTDGTEHPIEPRLVELVYRAVRQFRTPWVTVISGYRPGRATSRHAHGRAIDMVLPGVTDRRLAAWARRLGFVGVGIYPTSGFVHLDVREHSYFWSDSSGPGEENRERPILRSQWTRADRDARRRGVEPTSDEPIRAARAAEAAARSEAVDVDAEGGEGSPPPELLEEVEDAGVDAGAPDAGVPDAP